MEVPTMENWKPTKDDWFWMAAVALASVVALIVAYYMDGWPR
jgi:hypothetical protein